MAGRSQCVEVAYSHVIQRPRGNPQLYSKMASRFLCFGDSLTEVYSSIGCKFVGSSSAVSVHVVLLVVMAQIILSRPVSVVQVTQEINFVCRYSTGLHICYGNVPLLEAVEGASLRALQGAS